MTHLIDNWQRPPQVNVLQTSNTFSNLQNFDIHPKQSNPTLIQQLANQFQLPHVPMFLQQVHGNEIVEYTSQPNNQMELQADACFTRANNIICAVMTADCLPVLLTDSAGSFIAAVHCGWRSLYSNILKETLIRINTKHPVLAWFGPCIQQQQYEVDESFVINYLNQQPNSNTAFTDIKAGKSLASLSDMARIQLNDLGVKHIESTKQCTLLSPNYYSWRQNNTTRRMASMLWMTA